MKSEKDLQNYLQHECFINDLLFYKFASPSRRGVPDVLIICPERTVDKTVFVELKSPTGRGKLHPLQQFELNKLHDAGVPAYVLYTKDEVDHLIEGLVK
mgnify:CR=1 FL=1